MKENFITLFNFDYLPQGMNLYDSLKKHSKNFTLWVVCMDKKVEIFLKKKKLQNLNILTLRQIENTKLKNVKNDRSLVEYCFTITPFLPSYFFRNNKNIKRITYLDADIFFNKNPKKIIDEFKRSKKSILITEHGFDPKQDDSKRSGRFCVQYMIYKNNKKTEKILKWWQKKCLEWCYIHPEDGKLGDQKYLEAWPKLFKNDICISKNNQYFQAPWNVNRFNWNDGIIYHFHGLKIHYNKVYIFSKYGLNDKILKKIYLPYIKLLNNNVKKIGTDFYQNNEKRLFLKNIKYYLINFFKKKIIFKRYICDLNEMR